MKIRHVRQSDYKQKEPRCCGPACVAMVAGVSEAKAISANFGTRTPEDPTFWWKDVRNALEALEISHDAQARKIQHLENVRHLSIVGCHPEDHYVVFNPITKEVHDPLRAGPIPLSKFEMTPVSYLAIYR